MESAFPEWKAQPQNETGYFCVFDEAKRQMDADGKLEYADAPAGAGIEYIEIDDGVPGYDGESTRPSGTSLFNARLLIREITAAF